MPVGEPPWTRAARRGRRSPAPCPIGQPQRKRMRAIPGNVQCVKMILLCSASIGIADCSPGHCDRLLYGRRLTSSVRMWLRGPALTPRTALAPGSSRINIGIVCEGSTARLGSDRSPHRLLPFSASKGQPLECPAYGQDYEIWCVTAVSVRPPPGRERRLRSSTRPLVRQRPFPSTTRHKPPCRPVLPIHRYPMLGLVLESHRAPRSALVPSLRIAPCTFSRSPPDHWPIIHIEQRQEGH